MCDDPGVQIAARISERFVGPITPAAGTGDYTAPIGEQVPGDGNALWNIEGHIDFGYAIGAGTGPNALGDVVLVAQYDCNPAIDIIEEPNVPLGLVPATAILIQFSQNLGFFGACPNFDPNADGHYAFRVVVSDLNGVELAGVQINAIVGSPTTSPSLSAAGIIESQADGFKFPDGTIQTTAAVSAPPANPHPSTYVVTVKNDVPSAGGDLMFAACNAGDQIISGGGRCRAGTFADIMHKSCPANAAGACLDNGGTTFETWAVECEGNSRAFAYAVCLDLTP